MGVTKKMWDISRLMENVQQSILYGDVDLLPETDEKEYIEDVKLRIVKAEKEIDKLKNYLNM